MTSAQFWNDITWELLFKLVIFATMLVVALLPLAALATLQEDLETIVQHESEKYECAIAASIFSNSRSLALSAAAGQNSFNPDAKIVSVNDIFIWGSITKISTGTAILRLDQAGTISLNDTIPQYIDPMIAQMKADHPEFNFSAS
jgi:CubicO group peptidase (beta-lactamase class C family)